MGLECLLLCRDPEVLGVLGAAADKLSITLKVCQHSDSGQQMLFSEKYDGIIVDCDDLEDGAKILDQARKTPSNKSSVVFAIVNGSTTATQAFQRGANFVLQKPIQPVNAMRCLRAACAQMARERRRYFRVPIETLAVLTFLEGQKVKATATNLSEGGMAIRFPGKLPQAGVAKVHFTLPGTDTALEPKVELAWADESGKAGIKFLEVTETFRKQLDGWLLSTMNFAEIAPTS